MSVESSVKVGVRVRPLSANEVQDGCSSCLAYPIESDRIIIGKDKLFAFDFVFDESTPQSTLYMKAAFPMVECVLKGYNATLFAYGQTGSGKTYTMGTCGMENFSDTNCGIVPRMVEDIFEKMPSFPYDYTVRVSFLEIYKEDILDLLSDDATSPLPIREDNQIIKIPGLTERIVSSSADVLALLQSGSTKRSVGCTAMNSQSSRSHAIFTLHFVLRPKDPETNADGKSPEERQTSDEACSGETLTAKLHLVDLAGSERIKKTHAEGDRLKEGININRGLLALGNVISALCEKDAKKRSHIPYRDSRLTRLLQDSLGGNSTTLMLACVSPADSNMEETLNTLRYADRARMIKNKPILNRADPKDAELARLRSLVSQLQTRLTKGIGLPLVSPCRPLTSNQGGSTFSANVLSSMAEKTAKLEVEKRKLCDELDRALDDNSNLYRKVFDTETLRDAIFAEVDRFCTAFNSFKTSVSDELVEQNLGLKDFIEKVNCIIGAINSLRSSDQSELVRTKLDEAYEDCKLGEESSQFDAPVDESHEGDGTTHSPLVKLDSDTETTEGSRTIDRRGHELRVRRLACKQRMETLEANLQHKNQLLASLENAAALGDESYTSLLKQYESQVHELEMRIAELEKERVRLLSENDGKNKNSSEKQQREQRLNAMEQELTRARRELADLSRLKKAKEAREAECMRLRSEIQTLKVSMVRTAKQLKDESAEYRRWRAEKDREMRKLQEHDRRLQSEMSQMASVHERQQAVLKRRIEAAAATERRLKELLLLQRDRRNEREKRQTEIAGSLNKVDFASRVRAWVSADLEMQVGMGEARHHLHELMDSRRGLCSQLHKTEAELAMCDVQETATRDHLTAEIGRLTEAIESETHQINDLQQKLLDAGERYSVPDGSGSASIGQTDQMLSSRLAQLHNIQEARIALRYLFKEAISAKVKCIVFDTQVSEMELQLRTQQSESDQLRHKAVEFSMRLAQSEESESQLRDRVAVLEKNNIYLQNQINELQKSVVKQKTTSPAPVKNRKTTRYLVDANGEPRRLSGTPVVPQRKRVTRQSVQSQVDSKRWRHASPTILVPDSVKKVDASPWDVFDEIEDPADSSLLDPTWKLSDEATQERDDLGELPFGLGKQSHLGSGTRCKCRGECLNRCSCRRSGHSCLPGHCRCILGRCQNRRDLDLKSAAELMGPPVARPLGQKDKRRKTENPLNEIQKDKETNFVVSQHVDAEARVVLNRTFDLDEHENRTPEKHDLSNPTVSLVNISGRHLWPKARLSYFASPSLRADL